MTINSIRVKNFRCLKDVNLNLEKLNIIWGLNGTGKSSIFEAIYLLKQYINQRLVFPRGLQDSFNINFGEYKDIFRNGNIDNEIEIEIRLHISKNFQNDIINITDKIDEYLVALQEDFNTRILQYKYITYKISFSILNDIPRCKISYLFDDIEKISFGSVIESSGALSTKFIRPSTFSEKITPHSQTTSILYDFLYTQVNAAFKDVSELYQKLINKINFLFKLNLNRYYLLRPMRASIPINSQTKRIPDWIGLHGDYVIEFLSKIWGSREYLNIKNKIFYWAGEFGLKDLHAGWKDEHTLHADFEDPETRHVFNLSFAGTGSRQLLPVIIQIFNSNKGSTIAIEEPEISVHLKWQAKMFEMFYDAIKEGKQIIMSTHSPDFVPILERFLQKYPEMIKDTAVYHLHKDDEGTIAEKLKISKKGNLIEYPKSIKEAQKDLIAEFFVKLPSDEE